MNMLTCPSCNQPSDMFTVCGTLVTGEVSVRIGPNGLVTSIGPIKPHMLIKPGSELKGKYVLTCPHCGYSGRPDTYTLMRISLISGKAAQTNLYIEWLGIDIPIADGEEEQAHTIFSTTAFTSWDQRGRVLALLELP